MKIYSNQKTGQKCLYTEENIACQECDQKLHGGIYVEQYSKVMPANRGVYCNKCVVKAPSGYDIVNKHVLVSGFVPKGSVRWIPKPPALVAHRDRGSVFAAALVDDGARVVDNTVHANRLCFDISDVDLLPESRDSGLLLGFSNGSKEV